MDDTVKQYPLTLTINTPMHTPRLRGMQAKGPHALGALGDNIRVRISRHDREIIERVANNLGMTKAEFARWCTVEVARALETNDGTSAPMQPRGKLKYVEQLVFVPDDNDPPKSADAD